MSAFGRGGRTGVEGGSLTPTLRVRSAARIRLRYLDMDPMPGFGPGSARWRRAVLPLDDTGMAPPGGLEPPSADLESGILTARRRWQTKTSTIALSVRIGAGLPVAVIAALASSAEVGR